MSRKRKEGERLEEREREIKDRGIRKREKVRKKESLCDPEKEK